MSYYYFAASLPALTLGSAPPITFAAFAELAVQHLTPRDLRALGELSGPLTAGARHPFVQAWRRKETELRNAAAKTRAERLKRDASSFLREQTGMDVFLQRAVADALAREAALEREFALDKLRWVLADDLTGFNSFAIEAVLAYAVKLRLAERWAALNDAQGRRAVESLVAGQPRNARDAKAQAA
jgi:hypothetical protein